MSPRIAAIVPWLLTLVVLVGDAYGAPVEVSDQARALFKEGVQHLTASEPDYAAAYEAFQAAYDDSPSPKILGNLGLCATKLERDGEAIEAYETYLKEAGAKSGRERRQIAKDLRKLKKRGSTLQLTLTPAEVSLVDQRKRDDGSSVENAYAIEGGMVQLRLHAGKHQLHLVAAGHEALEIEIDLKAGATETRDISLTALPEIRPPEPTVDGDDSGDEAEGADGITIAAWTGVALTGTLALATVVVGSLAWSNKGDYDDAVAAGDTAEANELREGGGTLNTTGDVLLGFTIAAGTTTAVLMVLELSGDDDDGENEDSALSLAPIFNPSGAGLSLRGAF